MRRELAAIVLALIGLGVLALVAADTAASKARARECPPVEGAIVPRCLHLFGSMG